MEIIILILFTNIILITIFYLLSYSAGYYARLNFVYNFIFLLKFCLFYTLIFFYYIIYLLLYSVYFNLKQYRFFSYYFNNINTAFFYYRKKSIYFLFWRYLIICILSNFYLFFIFILNSIFIRNLYFIKQFYFLNYLLAKINLFNMWFWLQNIIDVWYKKYIYFLYHIFYILNIDEMFTLISKIKFNIFNILKNRRDPLLNRNIDLILFNNIFNFYKKLGINNFYFIYSKFLSIWNILCIFILNYIIIVISYCYIDKQKKCNINNIILSYYYRLIKKENITLNIILYFINFIKLFIAFINLILINITYYIILYVTYVIYISILFINKIKNIILFTIIIYILIKYYWFFFYYFYIIYKHYFLYLPVYEVKESTRFFSFEWIDLRNYFNIVFLHNSIVSLVDSNNNIIYQELYDNLNKLLSGYGFKLNYQYDLQLYALSDNILNTDTKVLNKYFHNYNNIRSYRLLKWYMRLKKKMLKRFNSIFQYHKSKKVSVKNDSSVLFKRSITKKQAANFSNYMINNKEVLFRSRYKKRFKVWKYMTKEYFSKKRTKADFVSLPIYYYSKLNKIPLKSIYIYNTDNYKRKRKIFNYYAKKIRAYFLAMIYIRRHVIYFYLWWKKIIKRNHYKLYFSNWLNFEHYKDMMHYKYKIPNMQWTALRWRRKFANHYFLSAVQLQHLNETHTWHTFYETKRKKLTKKHMYKVAFMKYQYPFYINNQGNILKSLSYNNIVGDYMKIIKKYYYIKGFQKVRKKFFYNRLILKCNTIVRIFKFRLICWQKPLYNNKYQYPGYDFWNFFDYLKINKYYSIKNNYKKQNKSNYDIDINLFFIKKTRKEYIKLRNILLRYYSLFYNYYYLKKVFFKHYYYDPRVHWSVKRDRAIKRNASFRALWYVKLTSTSHKSKVGWKLFKNISLLSKFFKKTFYAYFVYCDFTINKYNKLYYINVNNYRLRVLNKINNLKRFFYYHNKQQNGWSVIKYFNSFFFSYYIKHFLWHSPYSFLSHINLKINYFMKISGNTKYYLFYAIYNNKDAIDLKINITNYSFIFNLFLNVWIIDNYWYLQFNMNNKTLPNNIFIIYYNNGNFNPWMMSLYITDIYRLLITFLFYYYKNFLYRVTRYSYILNLKNYTFLEFLKHYFNIINLYKHWYFRYRTQISSRLLYGHFIKRRIRKYFPKKNLFADKIYYKQIAPIWFIYNYYIKLFVYFLLNKIYIKHFFIYYLLINNIFILKGFFIFCILNYYYLKFISLFFNKYILNIINYYFEIFNINVIEWKCVSLFINNLYGYFYSIFIYNKFYYLTRIQFNSNSINYDHIVLFWVVQLKKDITLYRYWVVLDINEWLNIINNFSIIYCYINTIFSIKYNYIIIFINKIDCLLYWLILMVSNIIEYNIKYILLIKIYCNKFLSYFLTSFLNFKNILIYLKTNYVYFRKQRNVGYRRRRKLLVIQKNFIHTVIKRNIYSFRHLTVNVNFLKNIYLINIYNYIYLLNNSINDGSVFSLFFFFFKYNIVFYNIIYYLVIYCVILFLLYLIYTKFFNLLFFCETVNNNYQDNWINLYNKKTVLLQSISYKKKDINIFKRIWLTKKKNFYSFFFNYNYNYWNVASINNKVLYKSILYNKKYNGFNVSNNNEITEGFNSINLWPFNYFIKYFKFLNIITKKPFSLKKENKIYKFYFLDSFNINLMNFCIFYWLLLIPYFFFEYILLKYHLKGHIRIKRRFILLLKLFLNNFKLYINIFKIIGKNQYSGWRVKYPRTYQGIRVKARKKFKYGFYLKWNRFSKTFLKMTPLGSYYYWFFRINKYEYYLSFYKYSFNFCIKSNYFKYVYLYVIICYLIKRNFASLFLFKFNNKKKCI